MAKKRKKAKRKTKRSKPKLKFKPRPVCRETSCGPEVRLAIWGIIAIVVIIVLVMYFTGML